MSKSVQPIGFRLATRKDWKSVWYADKNYADFLKEDIKLRNLIRQKLNNAGLEKAEIGRSQNNVEITLYVSKPGLVIGRGGTGIEKLKNELQVEVKGKLRLNVQETKQPNLSASLIADEIARQLERRMPYKRVINQTLRKVMDSGAKGVKVTVAGRLNGAEIARTEKKAIGLLPVSTITAEIDYSQATALTKYGTTGIKVWINRNLK